MSDIHKKESESGYKILSNIMEVVKDKLPTGNMGDYYTKEELRYHIEGNNLENSWMILKLARAFSSSRIPYKPINLTYVLTSEISHELYLCDRDLSKVFPTGTRPLESAPEYIIDALSEEAIFSSKLEGAVMTELAAKNMLRKNLPPRNKDEQMIVNNHLAMQFIRDKKDVLLTPEFIREIQGIVTKNTMQDKSQSGVFRSTDDVSVMDIRTGEVIHYPPDAEMIDSLISALCDFVNADCVPDPKEEDPFVHPVIAGIALHFLIGYIHPFYDGNGRTARTLFYWYVLSRGYEVFQYIPISKIIQQSPGKYRDAYLATEKDELDLTYFILYNIRCIRKARKALIDHLKLENSRKSTAEKTISALPDVTKRQAAILSYMFEYKTEEFGIREIADRFSVTYQTARTDLMHLADSGYLGVRKKGKAFFYQVRDDWLENAG
ncbi:MAG TPA: Fic family protein [Methanocorpusculum sp.]|nr:Fic family protein [Methanocorpusculum sp.]